MQSCARPLFICFCLVIVCSWHTEAQTTVAQEKANNTSASSSFSGWSDNRSGILTNPFNIAPMTCTDYSRKRANGTLELMNRPFSVVYARSRGTGLCLKWVLFNCSTDGVSLTPHTESPWM